MPNSSLCVCIIEDTPDHLEILEWCLAPLCNVRSFASPIAALVGLETFRPDVLLVDLAMPELDGVECLRRIRQLPGLKEIPAVALTAFAYPADRERCLKAGFQAFVAKPVVDFDLLRDLINRTATRKLSSS